MTDKISGEVEWTSYSKTLSPGIHTLEWKYIKDQTESIGNDYVEIRNILTE